MNQGFAALDGSGIAWKPLPKQAWAMMCPAFELLYGGSKGGAKTNFLVACWIPILQLAHQKYVATGRKQHKCRIAIFRKNLDDLKDFLAKTFEVYPVFDPKMGESGYNKNDKTWTFTSGATIQLRHLDGPTDHLGYNGNEFVGLGFDEVQYIPYEAYSFLVMQVRSSDPDYRKALKVRCTANPGGPHGDWLKGHFFINEHKEGGRVFAVRAKLPDGREVETTRAFIRSYLRDNPYLDPDGTYEARLRLTMSPDEVRMYMDGDFDVQAGAFFSHLIKPHVHFQQSRPIPSTWDMMMGIDWGSSAPAACYWLAKDPDGRVWVIDELHQPGISGRTFGEAMKEKFARQAWAKDRVFRVDDFYAVIDDQAMDSYGSDGTAADGIMSHGFRIFPAQKGPGQRRVGINQMKERLLLNADETPRLVVFEDRCPKLVSALKSIQSLAPKDPDDYDPHSPHAHACDALRFGLMEWPVDTRPGIDPAKAKVDRFWEKYHAAKNAANARTDRDVTGYE